MVRNKILDLLDSANGDFLSGETISQQLSLTRAAVWKQIKSLKEDGYEIDAQTKKGYRLLGKPLNIDEWTVRKNLKTDVLGRKLYFYDEITSTNERAKELAREGQGHGTVVLARTQNLGHGRLQRSWESPRGGLWMSVVLKPNLSLSDASKLTLGAGIAVVDSIEGLTDLKPGIKWPNDIIINGKKTAGILGEVVGEWSTIQTLILGIGINVNVNRNQLSPELPATTLWEEVKHEIDLNILAASILKNLEYEIAGLEKGNTDSLRERWTARAEGIGQTSVIQKGNKKFEGIFKGISADGELMLQVGEEIIVFSAGEVRMRSPKGEYF